MKALGLMINASGFSSDVENSTAKLWLSFGMMVSSLSFSSAVRNQTPRWRQLFTINIHSQHHPSRTPSPESYSVFDTTHLSSS